MVANVLFIAILPLCGSVSDRIGRKPVLLVGALGTAVLLFPPDAIIGHSAVMLGVAMSIAMSIAMVVIAMGAAIVPAVYAELFPPTSARSRSGSPTPSASRCSAAPRPTYSSTSAPMPGRRFTVYVIVLLLISAAVISRLPETRGRELHEEALPLPA